MIRVGQNRIYTPHMTVYLVKSLPKIPYIRIMFMILANPSCDVRRLPHARGVAARPFA
jgi:hypothetical protein